MEYRAGHITTERHKQIAAELELKVVQAKKDECRYVAVETYQLDATLDFLRQVSNVRDYYQRSHAELSRLQGPTQRGCNEGAGSVDSEAVG